MPGFRLFPRFVASAIGLITALTAGVPAGAQITNTATLSYIGSHGVVRRAITSNTVSIPAERAKRPTRLHFHLLPVGHALEGASCSATPDIAFTPAPIDAATLAAAPALVSTDVKAPIVMALDNPGGNHDPARREVARITMTAADFRDTVLLTETAPDSGVFAGGLPQGGLNASLVACDPALARGERLQLDFAEDDYSLASTSSVLVDPAGYVFDSMTGALIDGAEVTLLDASDRPATVFGDDGVSRYPSTVTSGASATDASGRTYHFSQGNYRFPRVGQGRYHLRIEPPGQYRAPSAQPREALAKLRDPAGAAFLINDASFGKAFTVAGTDPFYADIPLDRQGDTTLLLTKTASVREASPGDFVQYRVSIANRAESATTAVRVTDILPRGLRYKRGSTRGAEEPDVSADGRNLAFVIPAIAADGVADLRYVVAITPDAPRGEAVNRVLASGSDGSTGNEAAASVRIKALLFTDGFTLIGRVTEGGCGDPSTKRNGLPGIRLVLEDGTFVSTDRDGLYHIEGIRPGRHVVQIDTASIPASHEAVACDADTRSAGSAISRFVESDGGLLKRVNFQLRPTGKAVEVASVLPAQVATDAEAAGNRDWLAGQEPGIAMLFPEADHNPRAPALRVVIKHYPGQRVALSLNGAPVDPLAFDTTDSDASRNVAISRWTGLPLAEGDNRLEARVVDAAGATVEVLRRTVHSSSIPVAAAYVAEKSRLIADGLTRPLIAVRITDRAGRPVRDGTVVPFRVDQPYVAAVEAELQQARQNAGRAESTARVTGDDGLAFIALEPTTQAGAVHAIVTLADPDLATTSDVRAWLAASQKDWMIVGFGAGTIGYDTLKTRSAALPHGSRKDVVTDGQLAFYAKGRIRGSWLLTMAYDSDRSFDPDRGLLGTIDPDRYYTVYGDGSRQGYDAATRRKLYLRLERREFYALFGDFETGLTETRLGRYSRTLNGVKAEYHGKTVSLTGFGADTEERYGRDEIRGSGLSGPYRLSGRDIVPNSDKLRIEVRERLRPEQVLSSTALTRHIDYDIDTAMGTIRFREPVLSHDGALNPVFIVADYETYGKGRKRVAGGRALARLAGGKVELGASAIRDHAVGDGGGALVAADLRAKLGQGNEVRAELATGGRYGIGQGQAWLAEGEHHGPALDLLVYARQQDRGFGLGQQNLVEAGTRKLGADGSWRIADRLSLVGTLWHENQLDGPGSRTAGDARVEYLRDTGTLFAGGQFARDRGVDGQRRDSQLLTLGGSQALFGEKLTLTGQTQMALGSKDDSADFPVRHQLTAAWRVKDGIRLLGGYEIAKGADYTIHTARVGFDVAPWAGAKLTSAINQQSANTSLGGENGQRTFAQYGLSQSLSLGKSWMVDATLDASDTVRGKVPAGAAVGAFRPVTSGGGLIGQDNEGDFSAVTLGATYRSARWSWTGRIEHRDGEKDTRWNLTSNLLRSLGEGRTLAAGLRWSRVKQDSGSAASFLSADVALALRPLDSCWSVLERLEFRNERAGEGFTDNNALGVPAYGGGFQASLRVVNNLAVNYRSGAEGNGHGFEATLYYGAKWVRGSFGADDYTGYVDVLGFDLRKDMGRRFDIGVQASARHAWSRNVKSFAIGPSAGVSPGSNLWISAGYNVSGYRDRDFAEERYTRSGPYLTMRMKFDQLSLGRALRRAA